VIAAALRKAETLYVRLRGQGVGAILARGAAGALVMEVAGAGLTFGLHVVLARVMGVENYGVYAYALTWTMLLAILGRLGFNTSLLRFVAAYEGQAEWGLLRGVVRRSSQITLAASLLVLSGGCAVVFALRGRMPPTLFVTFLISFAIMPFLVLGQMRAAALRALRRIMIASVPERVFFPILLAGLGITAYFIRADALPAPQVMALHFMVLAGAFSLGCVFLRRALPAEALRAVPEYRTSEWVKVSCSMLLIAAMHTVLNRTDILMIGALMGTTHAGIYAVAVRVATLVVFVLSAVNAIAAPMISQLYATGRRNELQRMVTLAARAIFWLTAPIVAGLMLFAPHILSLFGDKFVTGQLALTILCSGQLINAFAGSVGFLMVMTGRHAEAAWVLGTSAVVNVTLNALLIPHFGIAGAAAATAATTGLWNIWLLVLVNRRLGIRSSVLQVI
jgi:O-antigen/teichoic acid export membrane protein